MDHSEVINEQIAKLAKAGFFEDYDLKVISARIHSQLATRLDSAGMLYNHTKQPVDFVLPLPIKGIGPDELIHTQFHYLFNPNEGHPLRMTGLSLGERENLQKFLVLKNEVLLPPERYINEWFTNKQLREGKPIGLFPTLLLQQADLLENKGYINDGVIDNRQHTVTGVMQRLQLALQRAEARNELHPGVQKFQLPIAIWDLNKMEKFEHNLHYQYEPGHTLKIKMVQSFVDGKEITQRLKNKGELMPAEKVHNTLLKARDELDNRQSQAIRHKR